MEIQSPNLAPEFPMRRGRRIAPSHSKNLQNSLNRTEEIMPDGPMPCRRCCASVARAIERYDSRPCRKAFWELAAPGSHNRLQAAVCSTRLACAPNDENAQKAGVLRNGETATGSTAHKDHHNMPQHFCGPEHSTMTRYAVRRWYG